MKKLKTFLLSFIYCLCVFALEAQTYPYKTVRLIIPFSRGSATDTIARVLAEELSAQWEQPIEAVNIPGSGGTVAAEKVARSVADGYTIFIHGAFAINPSFYKNLSYDPVADFTPIAAVAKQPLALVVPPSSRVRSISDLIARVKSRPNQLSYGSPGTGSGSHLTAEKFILASNIRISHISFNGGPETLAALNRDDIEFSFLPLAMAIKSEKSGSLRIIGVTSIQRVESLPQILSIHEQGLTGFEYNHWWGVWAPAGLPSEIAEKIEKDILEVLSNRETRNRFEAISIKAMEMSSLEFDRYVRSELDNISLLVKQTKILSTE